MPVTHVPKGSSAGGQFAPAKGSSSSSKAPAKKVGAKPAGFTKPPVKLSAAAIKYLASLKAASDWSKKTGLPVLYGTKKQKAEQRAYYMALARAKRKAARLLKAKQVAARRAATKKRVAANKAAAAKKRAAAAAKKSAAFKAKVARNNAAKRASNAKRK